MLNTKMTLQQLMMLTRYVLTLDFILLPIYFDTQDDESNNIFDQLPALAHIKTTSSGEELESYLNTDIEDIADPITWWYRHRKTYLHLSRMTLDYLTIPGAFFFIVGKFTLIVSL
jgi:hAT family C-terminal dimerisation region